MNYKLKKQIHTYPAGSIVYDDGSSWFVGSDELNHRGSIADGELAILFDHLKNQQSTSILEPIEDETK